MTSTNIEAHYILVTTALEATWGSSEKVLFLGEWCKKYERRHILEHRNHETLQFHWDDRVKLAQDYIYLENLHQSLLVALTQALNKLHGVDYNKRYWQILLDPWLMAYVGVIFDRWECIRIAFKINKYLHTVFINSKDSYKPPYSYEDFVSSSAFSDDWNQYLYQRIISYEYLDQCSIRAVNTSLSKPEIKIPSLRRRNFDFIRKLISITCSHFNRYFKSNTIVFIGASFNLYALLRLSLRLGQLPLFDVLDEYRPVGNDNGHPVPSLDSLKRSDIKIEFQSASTFEEFLKHSIANDIPSCLVEDYKMLREKISKVILSPKVIVTGSSHFADYFAKMWFAEHTFKGGQLLILEHGGSLPPFKELFNFEADISDLRASWFLSYHPKNVQMPPPKIIARNASSYAIYQKLITRKQYCTLIGNECARWVHRAHFYPMANQWSSSFKMTLEFYEQLDKSVKDYFRVKPYPSSQGWNTHQRFVDLLGSDKVYKERSLKKITLMSRVIVCSYPETTFSEAMASGVPTILMYPAHLYELNPIALPLLEILSAAKIVFHNPADAADHLNSIWVDPSQWWNSPTTVFAREEFSRQALNLAPNWIKKWADLLKAISLKPTT